jgi:hypothetical protein
VRVGFRRAVRERTLADVFVADAVHGPGLAQAGEALEGLLFHVRSVWGAGAAPHDVAGAVGVFPTANSEWRRSASSKLGEKGRMWDGRWVSEGWMEGVWEN